MDKSELYQGYERKTKQANKQKKTKNNFLSFLD